MHKAAAFLIFMSLLINVDKMLFLISLRKSLSKFSQIFSESFIIFLIVVAHNCLISLGSFSLACFLDNSNKNCSKLLFVKLLISCCALFLIS